MSILSPLSTLKKLAGRKSPDKPPSQIPKLPSFNFASSKCPRLMISSPKTEEGTPNTVMRVIEVNERMNVFTNNLKNGRSLSPKNERIKIKSKNKNAPQKISDSLNILRKNWEEMGAKKDLKIIKNLAGLCFSILEQICCKEVFLNKRDQESLKIMVNILKSEVYLKDDDKMVKKLQSLGVNFTLNQTTYHKLIYKMINKLEGNNLGFELDSKILESKVEKIEKINKNLNDKIKTIEEFQKTKMSLIEFEKKTLIYKNLLNSLDSNQKLDAIKNHSSIINEAVIRKEADDHDPDLHLEKLINIKSVSSDITAQYKSLLEKCKELMDKSKINEKTISHLIVENKNMRMMALVANEDMTPRPNFSDFRETLNLPFEFFLKKSSKLICRELHQIVKKELMQENRIVSKSKFSNYSLFSRRESRKAANESFNKHDSPSNFPSVQNLNDYTDLRSSELINTASFIRLPSKHLTLEEKLNE